MASRNDLRVDEDTLVILPRGLDRIWGFRKEIAVPLTSITSASVEAAPHKVRRGLRYPGTDAYWKISGTFHPGGERHYWNYAGTKEALTIRLDGTQHFHQLYLSVQDAVSAQRMIIDKVTALQRS